MSLRISNSTISRNYTRGLNKNMARLSDLNYKATSWRKFSTMAEDTVSGVRAFELRRNLARLETNRDNANSALSVIKAAEGQLSYGHDITKQFHSRIVEGNNGDMGPDDRKVLAEELTRLREQMVGVANGRFSDRYLFGGVEIANAPYQYDAKTINPSMESFHFALEKLKTARDGLAAPSADINTAIADIETALATSDGTNMAAVQGDITTALNNLSASPDVALVQSAYDDVTAANNGLVDVSVSSTLRFQGYDVATTLNPDSQYFNQDIYDLVQRDYYIDIGLGLDFDAAGNVDPNTAYKQSFNGLEVFGVGDKNIILQMDKLIAAITSENYDAEEVGKLLGEPNQGTGFLAAADALNLQVSKIGADTAYLEFVVGRYDDEEINLFERQKQVEAVDPAQAIMDYELQYTAYQAALQMGQRLLMPTLWDYVK